MSIIIAVFGFISAILAVVFGHGNRQVTDVAMGTGFFITGILYSIKAHKLKSRLP